MRDLAVTQTDKPWSATNRPPLNALPEGRQRLPPAASSLSRRSPDWLDDAKVTAAGLALSASFVLATVVGSFMIMVVVTAVVLAATLLSPFIGLMVLAATLPYPRPLGIPPTGLYLAMIAAILLGALLRLPIERPRPRRPSSEVLLLGAFMLYVSVQVAAAAPGGAMSARGDEIAFVLASFTTSALAFVVASVVLRRRSPYPVLATLLVSALLASATAIAQWTGTEGLFGGWIESMERFGRATGPFGDPNYFGAYLAAAATLAVACAVVTNTRWLKVTLLGLAGFVAASLLLTVSRGGLVSLAAGIVTIAFLRSRRTGFVTVAAMLLIAVIAYPMFAETRYGASSEFASRGVGAQLDQSDDRVGPWLAAGEVFLSTPLFGTGFGRLIEESAIGLGAHNWYLNVLAETGIVGFVLWALFTVAVILALRRRPPSPRTVGSSVLVTWMVASLFLDVPNTYQATGPVLIALAAALWAEWVPRRREQPSAAKRVARTITLPGWAKTQSQQIGRRREAGTTGGGTRTLTGR